MVREMEKASPTAVLEGKKKINGPRSNSSMTTVVSLIFGPDSSE